MITVEKRDGWTTRVINGQKRKFKTPKQAELTKHGDQLLQEEIDEYRDLTHEELVEKVHQLEVEVNQLQSGFNVFRKQIQEIRE